MLSLLSGFHFGSGDVAFARACRPADASAPVAALDAIVRGFIPLSIDRERRAAALPALAYAAFLASRAQRADALDNIVPAATLALSPSSLGFAAYFAVWHAPRHLALVLERDRRGGSAFVRLRAFARERSRFYSARSPSPRRAGGERRARLRRRSFSVLRCRTSSPSCTPSTIHRFHDSARAPAQIH